MSIFHNIYFNIIGIYLYIHIILYRHKCLNRQIYTFICIFLRHIYMFIYIYIDSFFFNIGICINNYRHTNKYIYIYIL